MASWVRNHSPQVIVLGTLAMTTAITILAAVVFQLWSAVAVALVAAFAQGLGKLALDAIVQREIGEEVRSSTFGVVEAFLQIAWVLGGLVGLWLSLFAGGSAGLAVMAAVLAGSLGWLLVRRRRRVREVDARVEAARDARPAPSGPHPATNGERPSRDATPEERAGPRPAGTTTTVVHHGDPPTEKRTRPLTNPHG